MLLFAKDPHVSFTNNRAERDLRMAQVKQKVSGCFRVQIYAQAYCRISSYLQTMANKGYNPLIAIQVALAGDAHSMGGKQLRKKKPVRMIKTFVYNMRVLVDRISFKKKL